MKSKTAARKPGPPAPSLRQLQDLHKRVVLAGMKTPAYRDLTKYLKSLPLNPKQLQMMQTDAGYAMIASAPTQTSWPVVCWTSPAVAADLKALQRDLRRLFRDI